MSNLYHLLHRLPAIERWEMPPSLEALAERLVASGRLRINADRERNFVRHGEHTFTTRELTDPALLPATRQVLARHVPPAAGASAISELLQHLQGELKKARGVDAAREMRVARCVVQAAHPSVIQLLLQSGTAVFVSYSHTVGDLLPVHEWQTHGDAGGLQATSETGTAVFISCGGDPFFEGEQKTYLTDGFPALARMLVIGGQELGHFADLLRHNGQILGRYSTDNAAARLRPSPVARMARLADMQQVARWQQQAARHGLGALRRAETHVAFYRKRRGFGPVLLFAQLWRGMVLGLFLLRSKSPHFHTYPSYPHGESLALFLGDMAFNLAPDAASYRHPDPLSEEAIACIEALARVPQQVNKWGHTLVARAWPQLYALYYGQVIPGCITAAGQPVPAVSRGLGQRLMVFFRQKLRKRPQYYP